MQESDGLKKLRELTPQLSAFADAGPFGEIEYKVDDGRCLSYSVFKSEDVTIARTWCSKGSHFPSHAHTKEREFILCYKGHIIIHTPDNIFELTPGIGCTIMEGVPHHADILEESEFFAASMPPAEGFPE